MGKDVGDVSTIETRVCEDAPRTPGPEEKDLSQPT